MAFGPDGYLYIAIGDGGGGDERRTPAAAIDTRLGKILRIDVDGTGEGANDAFAYPPDNPFVGVTGDDAIWAYGLRNPWRISFDRDTGDFWIGDVGQSTYEEIDRDAAPPSPRRGTTAGTSWRGCTATPPSSACDQSGLTLPVGEYAHGAANCSVTGGSSTAGRASATCRACTCSRDFCSGRIWTMPRPVASITERRDTNLLITVVRRERIRRALRSRTASARSIASSRPNSPTSPRAPSSTTSTGSSTRGSPAAAPPRSTARRPTSPASRWRSSWTGRWTCQRPGPDAFTDDEGRDRRGRDQPLAASGIATGCSADEVLPDGRRHPRADGDLPGPGAGPAIDRPPTTSPTTTGRTGEASINRLAERPGSRPAARRRTYCPTAIGDAWADGRVPAASVRVGQTRGAAPIGRRPTPAYNPPDVRSTSITRRPPRFAARSSTRCCRT